MCKVNGEEDELKEHLEYACMVPRVPQGLLESYHWCQQAGTPRRKAPSRQLQESLWVEARCGLAAAQGEALGRQRQTGGSGTLQGPLGPGLEEGRGVSAWPPLRLFSLLSLYNSLLLGRRGECD